FMYQMVYIVIVLFQNESHKLKSGDPFDPSIKKNKFAVLISGRNEQAVIGELVKSIKNQNYPKEIIDVYVIADNCTDDTAKVAKEAGAIVFERFDQQLKGKSHALNYAIKRIIKERGGSNKRTDYAGYFVFDADNVIDANFVAEMNRKFEKGYMVLTSYRNSKNFDTNWISAGSALWFMREGKYLSNARAIVDTSCAISGTGFLISSNILEKNECWIHHLLTEDIEFSIDCISNGIKIGYCEKAIVFDEQPTDMKHSWRQRLRWARGFYQVLIQYGKHLLNGMFKKEESKWSSYDMSMIIAPGMLIVLLSFILNLSFCIIGIVQLTMMAGSVIGIAISSMGSAMASADSNIFVSLFALISGSAFNGDALSAMTNSNAAVFASYAQARATVITSLLALAG
nr:glycosyltransferase family 2 protein [Clostridia bacterium]